MNCKRMWSLLSCLLALTPSLAAADVLDERWSLWPQGGVIFSDDRDFDTGWAAGLTATRPLGDNTVFELGGDYSLLGTQNAGDYERTSLRVGLQLFPGQPYRSSSSPVQPFIGGGAHYSQVDFLGQSPYAWGPYASVGTLLRLGDSFMLLLQARYQIDNVQEEDPVPEQDYYTWQALAGLRIALGAAPVDYSRDADGDGVPDALDKCPDTPRGTAVGADGCPLDSDGDGVPDSLDRCPGTPRGAQVGADGCELDSDGDGVPDSRDKCPDTPRGVEVKLDGCPTGDKDGDGVADALDECPDTPAGAKVLPNGCALEGDCRKPRPGEKVDARGCALDRNFILKGVKFEFDSDRLTPEAQLILNEVAGTLQSYSDLSVRLEGHTDGIGSDAYNLGLSERRANSVKAYLIGRGIGAVRMTPIGYGESRPIDTNDTESGRENNRRVELGVIE
ncbi:MAG: OmpA family protein [Sinimarinibacterium sp.]|jgi:OOP family OmpA-OmpF porin